MFKRLPALLVLGLLIAASSLLAWSLPGNAVAGTMFQSSPPNSPLATGTAIPSRTPTTAAVTRSAPAGRSSMTPTGAPTRAVAPAAVAPPAATRSSAEIAFLPAPTLTLPDKVPAIAVRSADAVSSEAAASAPPVDIDVAAGSTTRTGMALLIDRVAIVLGYAWLLVGSLVLIIAAVFLGWLLRRTVHD